MRRCLGGMSPRRWVNVRAATDRSPLQGSDFLGTVTQGFALGCDGVAPSGLGFVVVQNELPSVYFVMRAIDSGRKGSNGIGNVETFGVLRLRVSQRTRDASLRMTLLGWEHKEQTISQG